MARLEHGGVDLAHGVMHCATHPPTNSTIHPTLHYTTHPPIPCTLHCTIPPFTLHYTSLHCTIPPYIALYLPTLHYTSPPLPILRYNLHRTEHCTSSIVPNPTPYILHHTLQVIGDQMANSLRPLCNAEGTRGGWVLGKNHMSPMLQMQQFADTQVVAMIKVWKHIFLENFPLVQKHLRVSGCMGKCATKNLLKMGAIFLLVVAVLPVVAVVAYAETAPSSGLLPGGQCTMWLSHWKNGN